LTDHLSKLPGPGPGQRLPPLWFNMPLLPWLALLARNGFRVAPRRWPLVLAVTLWAPVNSLLLLLQRLVLALRPPPDPPDVLLVVGHPRSGTTLLHEYLALDPRHSAPDGYDCFCPCHSLLTRAWVAPLLDRLMPKTRQIDAMAFGLLRPQEDEFALHLLGASPLYDLMAFPDSSFAAAQRRLDARKDRAERRLLRWHRYFLVVAGAGRSGRIVLKSPPHALRLSLLRRALPRMKVVHIVRDPRVTLPSFVQSFRVLQATLALGRTPSKSDAEWLAEFLWFFERAEQERHGLPPQQLIEVRYEDLIAQPVETLAGIYRQLELGDFAPVRPLLEQRLDKLRDYRATGRRLPAEAERLIASACAGLMRRYGYDPDATAGAPARGR
jgi:hypothetical protein